MENNLKYASPKSDIVFRMLFGEKQSERITKSLVESIIKEKIDSIDLSRTPTLTGISADDKYSIVDIMAIINGDTKIDIEMQMTTPKFLYKKLLSYWSKMYNGDLKSGENYDKLTRVICIMFVNDDLPELKELQALTSWKIIDENERKTILTDDLQLCIIELNKAKRQGTDKKLLKWIQFIENPSGELIQNMAKTDKEIEEAIQLLEKLSADKETMDIIEARQRYRIEMNSMRSEAIRDGQEIGFKSGHEKGLVDGKAEGIAEGRAEGRAEEKGRIAKQLLARNVDIKIISETTGLSEEEITNL